MSHYGRDNIWLTDIITWIWNHGQLEHYIDLVYKYSIGLQEIFVSRLCSQEENYFFLPCWETRVQSLVAPLLKVLEIAEEKELPLHWHQEMVRRSRLLG